MEGALDEHNESLEVIAEYDESSIDAALGDAGKSKGWIEPDPQP